MLNSKIPNAQVFRINDELCGENLVIFIPKLAAFNKIIK